MQIIIRPITPADYDQWLPLWLGYNAFYGRSGPTALAEEITQSTWDRFFDPQEPVHALVAEIKGEQHSRLVGPNKLVGLVHYLYHRSTTSIAPICYLNDLFTDESLRGQGIGHKLIEAVYEEARSAGSARVYWLTHETNATAMHLYDKVADKSGFLVYRKSLD
jgi:GNAT superfamily N-acetyltransferase